MAGGARCRLPHDESNFSVTPRLDRRLQIDTIVKGKQVMEKSAQTSTDHSTVISEQQKTCCGGKTKASEAPREPAGISVVIDSAAAPPQNPIQWLTMML